MRRVMLMLAAIAVMVSLFAVAAYAADIQGTNNTEQLNESNKNDQIHALSGDDDIFAGVYQNIGDSDRAHGNKGDDFIDLRDQDIKDHAWGGKGEDDCWGETGDSFTGCEFVNGVEK
jgi:RTX calcium-binding nonapeptide repeat (4 copies)